MNDVLRTLREARPAELDPDAPVGDDVRQTEIARAMAAGSDAAAPGKAVRRRVRPVWGLGLAGAVAAGALVAATLVSPGGDGPEGDRAGGGPAPGTEERFDARTVLLAAAEKADGQTDTMRTYWHTTRILSQTFMAGGPGARYAVVTREKYEDWTPTKPGLEGWRSEQYLGAEPATEEDREAWRRAGSPDPFQVQAAVDPGLKVIEPRTKKAAPGPVTMRRTRLGHRMPMIGEDVVLKDLRSLPSDPKRLEAQLRRWSGGRYIDVSGRPMSADEALYLVASQLVLVMPVRPEVRAAGFRMLAGLPSVKSLGEVTGPRGRTGNAIAVDEKTPGGVVRHQLIIDLSTGTALAREDIMLKPAAGAKISAGWKLNSLAVVGAEWTDSPPR